MKFDSERITSIQNVFAYGGLFVGDFILTSSLRLDGVLQGNVLTDDRFLISRTGKGVGVIRASIIDVGGFFKGDLFASNLVIIRSTGVVKGRICASFLEIQEGGYYEGFCKVSNDFMNHYLASYFYKVMEKSILKNNPENIRLNLNQKDVFYKIMEKSILKNNPENIRLNLNQKDIFISD